MTSRTWQPSHQRSEETGKILDRAFEGENAVPFTVPPQEYFDDPPEKVTPPSDFDTYCDRVLDALDGSPRTSGIRVAAFKRIMGRDDRKLRVIAAEVGCSVSTLHDAIAAAKRKLFSTPPEKLER